MNNNSWYAARTVYNCYPNKKSKKKIYEERVVLFVAKSFNNAIKKAEKEADEYSNANQMKYLGFVNVFKLFEQSITNGTEVYSLMRESKLNGRKYLNSFFDTGKEKTKK